MADRRRHREQPAIRRGDVRRLPGECRRRWPSWIASPNGDGYVSGRVTTPWTWTPGTGATWAFEMVAKMPPAAARFPAFWTSSATGWVDERDFVEAHPGFLDSDWIYSTGTTGTPKAQDYETSPWPFDPSAAMHRYTYEVLPDGSWRFYLDGQLQTWAGGPSRPYLAVPMTIILNYALAGGGGPGSSSAFSVASVAAYVDTSHSAGVARTIAPGTSIGGTSQSSDDGDGFGMRLIQAASGELGKPYLYGGAGPDAFDCSGLVLVAAAEASDGRLQLPHGSEIQATLGQRRRRRAWIQGVR